MLCSKGRTGSPGGTLIHLLGGVTRFGIDPRSGRQEFVALTSPFEKLLGALHASIGLQHGQCGLGAGK